MGKKNPVSYKMEY